MRFNQTRSVARGRVDRRSVELAIRDLNPRDGAATSAVLDPLAVAAAEGSFEAVELLVKAVDEHRLAYPSIRRMLVDEDEVNEVAQDVLVAVAETIGGFRGEARFTTWLSQVARFKTIAHLRRTRRGSTTELDADDPGAGSVGDAQRISSLIATQTSVAQAIDALPELYRSAVVLRDLEDLTYDEIAERLDIHPGTAKTRVCRGRALVAARLTL